MKKFDLFFGRDLAAMSALLYVLCSYMSTAQAAEADIFGKWVVPGADAVLSIVPDGGSARIILSEALDPHALDENNPDPSLQKRTLRGITLGDGFEFSGDAWSGGSLYDPESGNSYRATLRIIDRNLLQVRGYIGISLLGRSQTWSRLEYFAPRMLRMLSGNEEHSHDH